MTYISITNSIYWSSGISPELQLKEVRLNEFS